MARNRPLKVEKEETLKVKVNNRETVVCEVPNQFRQSIYHGVQLMRMPAKLAEATGAKIITRFA